MATDLSLYIKAGYTPIAGCREDSAVSYVTFILGCPVVLRDDRFWAMGEIPTDYYYEDGNLFKRAS